MKQYHELLKTILGTGEVQWEPRTEEYIIGVPSERKVYDLRDGFPLMTTKWVPLELPSEELFWKLRGEHTAKTLHDKKITIWDGNAFDYYLKVNNLKDKFPKHSKEWHEEYERFKVKLSDGSESGELGPLYGFQWRHWRKPVFVKGHTEGTEWVPEQWVVKEVDQLKNVLKSIREKPGSRYHIMNAWNSGEVSDMSLGPCPFWDQFTVYGNNLDLTAGQRSCDTYLGVPFNIAQEALLLSMVAKETGFNARRLHHHTFNTHIYLGVQPRSNFWLDQSNVTEFQRRFNGATERGDYLSIRDWYVSTAPAETPKENEKKDHVPFVLEQLSKEPKSLPQLVLENIPLLDAIERPVSEVAKVVNYDPHRWKSRAWMAA